MVFTGGRELELNQLRPIKFSPIYVNERTNLTFLYIFLSLTSPIMEGSQSANTVGVAAVP